MSKTLKFLEGRISELEEKLESAETSARFNSDVEKWFWTRHREDWPDRGLPVPRLEMLWTDMSGTWSRMEALYVLVYRHWGTDKLMAVPMGLTRRDGGGGRPVTPSRGVDTPFRDGAHIRHDAAQLGLPAYAVCGDDVTEVKVGDR